MARPRAYLRSGVALMVPAAALASVACLACGGDANRRAEAGGWADTVSSGRVVVTNPADGAWGPDHGWRVVEELRLGKLEGEGPDLFGEVAAVALDRFDRIWVLERQAQEIRVFDREGRHVRTIGRKGEGPGEFRDALGMAFGPGDRLWVVDSQFGRVSIFDSAGALVATHRTAGGHSVMPRPGGFDRTGAFYDVARDPTAPGQSVVIRYDSTLSPLDTLRPPHWEDPGALVESVSADGRSRRRSAIPFTPRSVWALTPEGDFWALHTGAYRLDRVSAAGDTVRTATLPFEPVPVTAAEKEVVIKAVERFNRRTGILEPARIPDHKPPVTAVYVAEDGYVWVSRVSSVPAAEVCDVFDPQGRYLGQVGLPFRMRLAPVIRDDVVVAVTDGAMGVPYVVRARIEKH